MIGTCDCSPFCKMTAPKGSGLKREIVKIEVATEGPEINSIEHCCALGSEYSNCAMFNIYKSNNRIVEA